ncbi:MAG: hypothetical protein M1831_005369 [Alyxoria varia]|nr:MAG: hypothetical protein M1831_005369 [Alyxoria varia]
MAPRRESLKHGKQSALKATKSHRAKQQSVTKAVYGSYEIQPSYLSLYPSESFHSFSIERLFVCPHCYKYTEDENAYFQHWKSFCNFKESAPGCIVYDSSEYMVHEIDGEDEPVGSLLHLASSQNLTHSLQLFCQNLSLFAKLFIDNKSICYDVTTFVYYLVVSNPTNERESEVMGFFSKEKLSWDNNNLACILVFPPWQGRGLGQFLIGVSYEVAKRDGRLGGPERPLSESGKRSYEAYWAGAIARYILEREDQESTSVNDMSRATFITPEDIFNTTVRMGLLGRQNKNTFILSKVAVHDWMNRTRANITSPCAAEAFEFSDASASSSEQMEEDEGDENASNEENEDDSEI